MVQNDLLDLEVHMNTSRVKQWLGLAPNDGCEPFWPALQAEDAAANLATMRRFAMFGILIELFNLFLVLVVSRVKLGTLNNKIYFSLYLLLLVLLVIDLVVLHPYRRAITLPVRKISTINFFYCLIFCLWSAAVTFQDLQHNVNISVYSFSMIIIAVLFLLKPWQSIIIFGATQILFLCSLPFSPLPDGQQGVVTNSTIVAFICCCMSFSRYHGHRRQFTNTRIIVEQNKKIQQANLRLSDLLIQDPLTGLYNRRFLTDSLIGQWHDYVRQEQLITVCMLDIDHFKAFNDQYGHQAGDECLQQLAATLRAAVQGRDCYVIRYGGEEFLLVFFGLPVDEVPQAADAVRRRVEGVPIRLADDGAGIPITVSIGVCSATMHAASNLELLIHRADVALYAAKAAGRNCVRFAPVQP